MEGTLLAVDVGMRAGLAWFGTDGRLLHSRSARFANRAVLRRAVPAILAERPPVRLVVLEGMGPVADIWMRSLERLGVPFEQVSAETWREAMLLRRERRSGEQAKQHAARLAAPLLAGTHEYAATARATAGFNFKLPAYLDLSLAANYAYYGLGAEASLSLRF